MFDLDKINDSMSDDLTSAGHWAEKIYSETFGSTFDGVRELFNRLQSDTHPITDEEINWVLTTLPLQLFSASEHLSQLRTKSDVVKMVTKQLKADYVKQSAETTATKKNEEADEKLLGNKLLASVYDNIIARVESELSFSRELIMSCKKLFDARRSTENINPVGMVTPADSTWNGDSIDPGFYQPIPDPREPVKTAEPAYTNELGDIKVAF